MIVLSHFQVQPLLDAWVRGEPACPVSLDLNLTTGEAALGPDGVTLPGGALLPWEQAEQIAASENRCFVLEGGQLEPIQFFSETTHWPRSLMPTENAPTMLVAGLPMHRIKGVDPYQDTRRKIKAASPVVGRVLDTATGLGYTAIQAARTAEEVITVELDPTSLQIARLNPWSADLFDDPRITQIVGDVWDAVEEMADDTFSCIIHDPPTFSLAGELYSTDFYTELYRVLRRKGRLFHYVGDPASKSGANVTRGVVRRLGEAGFTRVKRRPEAFGVLALK
jgi:predicted methyltransferase